MKECDCGCKELIPEINKKGKLARFKKGHNPSNLPINWKGDSVGYTTLHQWIRRHLPIPDLCQICNQRHPYDLANITGIRNRDFNNWKYLCRSCHRKLDKSGFQKGHKMGFFGKHHTQEAKSQISISERRTKSVLKVYGEV